MAGISTFIAMFLAALTIVSSGFPVAHADADFISRTCNKTNNATLCVVVLSADPESAQAYSEHHLAMIALDIATNTAKHNTKFINDLAKNNQSTSEGEALAICLNAYTEAADGLEISADLDFSVGNYYDTLDVVSFAMGASDSCERAFKGIKKKSPVADIDRQMIERCSVARNLINLLVHK